jgi:hypothetical protein
LCKKLGLVTGRRSNPIGLAFTLQKTAAGTSASIDLMNHTNQVINGEEKAPGVSPDAGAVCLPG